MTRLHRAGAFLWVGVLTGCYTVTPVPPQEAPAPPPPAAPATAAEKVRERVVETRTVSDADLLLSYYVATATLPRDQQQRELERAKRQYESAGGSQARMQLVLARLALNGEARETDKALELLQIQLSSKDDINPELRALATLLRQLLGDNRQLESNLEAQRERLKEESKKSDALRQKLEALVEAERRLLERNRPK